MMYKNKVILWTFTLSMILALVLASCATTPTVTPEEPTAQQSDPSPAEPATEQANPTPVSKIPETGEDLDMDALIAAAQAEGELVAYWHSSRIEKAGNLFEEKYGITVNGTKMNDSEQTERVIREVESGNVQVDVIGYDDGGTLVTQLIPEGIVTTWVPPNIEDILSDADRDPLIYLWQPRFFGYNTEVYGETCPIDNVWQLTEDEWTGKVIIRDPQVTTAQLGFFAAIASSPDLMEQAYRDHYGEDLVVTEENAGWEYLKRLFQNNILVMGSDDDVSQAVGGAGQTDPPIGMYTYTKHRNMEELNLHLGICDSMEPFMGYALPTFVAQVNGAPHPNAAKLFTHFVLTEEGVAPWVLEDLGGYSPNPEVSANPEDEIGSWENWKELLITFDPEEAIRIRQDLTDFWMVNSR
jgi:iron(III) transport system substrate-binding protein